LNHKDAHLELN